MTSKLRGPRVKLETQKEQDVETWVYFYERFFEFVSDSPDSPIDFKKSEDTARVLYRRLVGRGLCERQEGWGADHPLPHPPRADPPTSP